MFLSFVLWRKRFIHCQVRLRACNVACCLTCKLELEFICKLSVGARDVFVTGRGRLQVASPWPRRRKSEAVHSSGALRGFVWNARRPKFAVVAHSCPGCFLCTDRMLSPAVFDTLAALALLFIALVGEQGESLSLPGSHCHQLECCSNLLQLLELAQLIPMRDFVQERMLQDCCITGERKGPVPQEGVFFTS